MCKCVRAVAALVFVFCHANADQETEGEADPFVVPEAGTARLPWPPDLEPLTDPKRIVAGCFTGQEIQSFVINNAGNLTLMVAPDSLVSFFELSTGLGVIDLGVLQDGGGKGLDSILVTSPRGLVELAFDEVEQKFLETSIEESLWLDAQRILVADVHQDGDADFVGLGSASDEVLLLLQTTKSPRSSVRWALPGAAREIVVADLVPGGERELIVLSDAGLDVYDSRGALLQSTPGANAQGTIVRIDEPLEERVMWITPDRNGDLFLYELTQTGIGPSAIQLARPLSGSPLSLDLDVYGAVGGDWDGDGYDDLLLLHHTDSRAVILLNQGTSFPFSISAASVDHVLVDLAADPDAPAPDQTCIFAFADFAQSGRSGIAAPNVDTAEMVVSRELNDDEVFIRRTGSGQGVEGNFLYSESYYDYDEVEDILWIDLVFAVVPETLLAYTHLQIIVWTQPGADEPVSNEAIGNWLYSLEDVDPELPQSVRIGFDDGLGSVYWEDGRHRYLQLRFVNALAESDPPHITATSPSLKLGLTTVVYEGQDGEEAFAFLRDLPGSGNEVPLVESPTNGGTEFATIIVEEWVPPFPPGVVPDPTPPQTGVYPLMVPWDL